MRKSFLNVREVADRLEQHEDRILDALSFGELPMIWAGCERLIPVDALPPYSRPSEEES